MTTTDDVLDHHLTAFGDRDLPELMTDYTEESVVITPTGTYRGRDDIETLFEGMLAEFDGTEASLDVDERTVADETAHIVWHGETPETVYEYAVDTFVVRDGVIETQTFAAKTTAKE
ncbi:nuclear transport factor 2 family protein [Halorarius halobius]|uniref:nuclear transport factor 2 family protein n=1 Tax=Halorarius halobius TaxID=2962671 RepID=UPI0020CC4552|nr:nuclear transport factor 2 family protein [Halorarius halobius]